jgi:hypothetical protein
MYIMHNIYSFLFLFFWKILKLISGYFIVKKKVAPNHSRAGRSLRPRHGGAVPHHARSREYLFVGGKMGNG